MASVVSVGGNDVHQPCGHSCHHSADNSFSRERGPPQRVEGREKLVQIRSSRGKVYGGGVVVIFSFHLFHTVPNQIRKDSSVRPSVIGGPSILDVEIVHLWMLKEYPLLRRPDHIPSLDEILAGLRQRYPGQFSNKPECLESTDLAIRFTKAFPNKNKELICTILTAYTHYFGGLGNRAGSSSAHWYHRWTANSDRQWQIRARDVLISTTRPLDAVFLMQYSGFLIDTNLRLAGYGVPDYVTRTSLISRSILSRAICTRTTTNGIDG